MGVMPFSLYLVIKGLNISLASIFLQLEFQLGFLGNQLVEQFVHGVQDNGENGVSNLARIRNRLDWMVTNTMSMCLIGSKV